MEELSLFSKSLKLLNDIGHSTINLNEEQLIVFGGVNGLHLCINKTNIAQIIANQLWYDLDSTNAFVLTFNKPVFMNR